MTASYMTHTMSFSQPAAGQYRPPLEGIAGQIATEYIDVIKQAAANDPRSLQTELGPSDLGTPCMRRLGYGMLAWTKTNPDTDPWATIVGKAVHAWLAETFTTENRRLGRERYLVENPVSVPGITALTPVGGHSDIYDRDLRSVVDWKIPGITAIRGYRKNGPGQQYRAQGHIYGLGFQLAGETPEHVSIAFLPRSGVLSEAHVWSEAYNPSIAVKAIERYQRVYNFLTTPSLDPERTPANWALLPAADAYCSYCPWFLPGSRDLSSGCPGHNPK